MIATSPQRPYAAPRPAQPQVGSLWSRLVSTLTAFRARWPRERYEIGTPITWHCDCD